MVGSVGSGRIEIGAIHTHGDSCISNHSGPTDPFMITHDLKEGFELGTRLLVFDKTRLDMQAPEAYGATITYDIPLHVTTPALLRELNDAKTRTERFADVVAVGS